MPNTIKERTARNWISFGIFLICGIIIIVQGSNIVDNQRRREAAEQARDLAERLKDEERIRAELIIVSSPYAILMCNDNQQIIVSNQSAERMFGWSHEEMAGMHVSRIVPEKHRRGHAIASEAAEQKMRSLKENWIYSKTMESEGLRKDGSTFPIVLNVRAIKYRHSNGSKIEFIAAIREKDPDLPEVEIRPLPLLEERIQKSRMEMKDSIRNLKDH